MPNSCKRIVLSISVLTALLFYGCKETNNSPVEPSPAGEPYIVSAWDYSHSYFFLDTSYFLVYENYLRCE